MKQKLSLYLKIVITILLMIYVIFHIDIQQVFAVLLATNPYYTIIGVGLSVFSLLIIASRWAIILKIFYPELTIGKLFKCYWIGAFFSLFLPSSLSGDIVRIYKINKKHGGLHKIITTGLIDRVIGFFTLMALGTIIIAFNKTALKIPNTYGYYLVFFWIGFLIAILAIWFLLNNNTILTGLKKVKMFDQAIKWLRECVSLIRNHLSVVYAAFSLSVFSLLVFLMGILCFARAVGITVDWPHLCLIALIVSIIISIPISINGIGVQDGAYLFFLGQAGVASSYALSLSLVLHFSKYLVYSLGGLIYLIDND